MLSYYISIGFFTLSFYCALYAMITYFGTSYLQFLFLLVLLLFLLFLLRDFWFTLCFILGLLICFYFYRFTSYCCMDFDYDSLVIICMGWVVICIDVVLSLSALGYFGLSVLYFLTIYNNNNKSSTV